MATEHAYFVLLLLAGTGVYSKSTYKICVPVQYMKACEEMLEVPTKSKAVLECVPARDRVDCLYYVQQRQADIVPVDPEDMYVASKIPNQDFVVFQEYRTDDEPDAEFRYQAVIVVHKDLPVNNLDQLKGLKSCHTGVNRNVGYKIPLTMLMKRAIFPKMNDHSISPKENELKALSTFFKQSCIVGKWSPDEATNTAWKTQYSQLCALCEHPDKCDYPDNFSGYEGALRCLAHNGGEVAFTKVIYVRKFFGLPVGTIPASPSTENPDEFRYLCSDGSKVQIRDKACSWAARPWQGLLGHNDVLASLSPIREKIKQLANVGATTKPEWFTNVLGLSEKIHHVADNIPIKPADYLKKANYTEVIERGHGAPEPVVRMCVTSNVALAKCRAMSVFAFSRDIRPRLDCVQESSTDDCLRSVQDNGSDLTSVDDLQDIGVISRFTTLNPVFHEVYGEKKTSNYAVAVVKKNTAYNKIEDLRGKRSCHDPYGSFSGLDAPLYHLVKKTLIRAEQCVKNLGEFFSGGSCLPGVDKSENNPKGTDVTKLLKQCPADNSPVKCLQEDKGDVAFVSSADLQNFDSSQYELICLNKAAGGRDSLSSFASCNIALAPSRTWLSAKETLSDVAIYHTPLSLAQLLDANTGLFNIYGEFLKNNNVIFSSAATGLATVPKDQRDAYFSKYKEIRDTISSCN